MAAPEEVRNIIRGRMIMLDDVMKATKNEYDRHIKAEAERDILSAWLIADLNGKQERA